MEVTENNQCPCCGEIRNYLIKLPVKMSRQTMDEEFFYTRKGFSGKKPDKICFDCLERETEEVFRQIKGDGKHEDQQSPNDTIHHG